MGEIGEGEGEGRVEEVREDPIQIGNKICRWVPMVDVAWDEEEVVEWEVEVVEVARMTQVGVEAVVVVATMDLTIRVILLEEEMPEEEEGVKVEVVEVQVHTVSSKVDLICLEEEEEKVVEVVHEIR